MSAKEIKEDNWEDIPHHVLWSALLEIHAKEIQSYVDYEREDRKKRTEEANKKSKGV